MLKDVGDGRRGRALRSPNEHKSPSRKKRNRQSASNDIGRDFTNRLPQSSCVFVITGAFTVLNFHNNNTVFKSLFHNVFHGATIMRLRTKDSYDEIGRCCRSEKLLFLQRQ